jgi:hypothetical protein
MWQSRRDFQRVWEGWKAGFLAFEAFHTLSFPWPAVGKHIPKSQLARWAACANRDHLSEMATIRPEPDLGLPQRSFPGLAFPFLPEPRVYAKGTGCNASERVSRYARNVSIRKKPRSEYT